MSDHHLEHSDVIRVIGQSHTSFDDAVTQALRQLAFPSHGHDHHPNMKFTSFEVVKMGGYIHHDKDEKAINVTHFSVTLDVEARHEHGDAQ